MTIDDDARVRRIAWQTTHFLTMTPQRAHSDSAVTAESVTATCRMDKCSNKFSDVANYSHCITKEELIISDTDEEIDVEKVTESVDQVPANAYFSYSGTEPEKFNDPDQFDGTLAIRKGERLRNNNIKANDRKQTILDVRVKSKNIKSDDEQSSNDLLNNEKSQTFQYNIDAMAKEVAKTYCEKCKKDGPVVRWKARCSKCNTHLSYICQTCDKTYSAFNDLGYHLKVKHIEAHLTYSCSSCGQTFATAKGLMVHRRIQHNIHHSLQCSKCGKKFSRPVNMVIHEKFCGKQPDKNENYKCDKCAYVTCYKARLKSHTLEKHAVGFKAECKNCSKAFKTRCSLRRHLNIYCNKTKTFECDLCGHKFYRKDQIVRHLDRFHTKREF